MRIIALWAHTQFSNKAEMRLFEDTWNAKCSDLCTCAAFMLSLNWVKGSSTYTKWNPSKIRIDANWSL